MEDTGIIDLYHARDERAIAESERKYGAYCRAVALNLLSVREDAEECVNDTWHAAWDRMPPERPNALKAFLGRITRNLSISRFRANRAQKRFDGMETLLSELDDCVPDPHGVEEEVEGHVLSGLISRWLDGLSVDDCTLFVRRYWYGDAVKELARRWGCTPNSMAQRMLVLRRDLKSFLEKEGIAV